MRDTQWKPIFITLACSGLIGFACCASGSPARNSVPLLIIGAIALIVFVLQALVAIVRLAIDVIRK
jgi:hypothetical protein